MKQQFISTLLILVFAACANEHAKERKSRLEYYIKGTDSLTSNSKLFDKISIDLIKTFEEAKPDYPISTANDTTGELKVQTFRIIYDTIGKSHYLLSNSIKISEYVSERRAAEAFWKIIEFQACCIPDEDIVKLKNFENLEDFKNGPSTTIYSENILIELDFGGGDKGEENNNMFSVYFDKFFKDKKSTKLEIGNGGPAIWTKTPPNL